MSSAPLSGPHSSRQPILPASLCWRPSVLMLFLKIIRYTTPGPLHLLLNALPSESCMPCSSLSSGHCSDMTNEIPSLTILYRKVTLLSGPFHGPSCCIFLHGHPTYYVYYLLNERTNGNREVPHSWQSPLALNVGSRDPFQSCLQCSF